MKLSLDPSRLALCTRMLLTAGTALALAGPALATAAGVTGVTSGATPPASASVQPVNPAGPSASGTLNGNLPDLTHMSPAEQARVPHRRSRGTPATPMVVTPLPAPAATATSR